MKKVFWILPCLVLALSAGDVTGKWSGTIDVEDAGSTTEVQAQLVQKAGAISGKIGQPGDADAGTIQNGKVDGVNVSFEVVSSHTSSPVKFRLTLVNDRLEGEMKGSTDDGEFVGKVKLTRAAP